jgi:hypothetical protein
VQDAPKRSATPTTSGAVDVAAYVAASLGPPRWLERLQDIESEEIRVLGDLEREWLALAAATGAAPASFAEAWSARATAFDLSELNLLIGRHNEYFPIERRLPFDLRSGDYRAPWGIPWRRTPRDAAWILERFPADRAAAQAHASSAEGDQTDEEPAVEPLRRPPRSG